MWPNEQINGISFCGALMNGENHAIFFLRRVGGCRGTHTHTLTHADCAFSRLKRLVHKQ